jgi:hypothetical protein
VLIGLPTGTIPENVNIKNNMNAKQRILSAIIPSSELVGSFIIYIVDILFDGVSLNKKILSKGSRRAGVRR